MPDIDERIVSMKFDNKQFEKNARTTINTLGDLDKSLAFKNTSGFSKISSAFGTVANAALKFQDTVHKVFDGVKKTANGEILGGVQESLDQIVAGTSNLGSRFDRILNSIQGKIDQTLSRLWNGVAIEPMTDGFSEYELKMGSVQTIMASTGASLEEVNGYLEELNKYADRTIYSFSDMTASIGKFTNAGVELSDAVSAIQGISNVAAKSGAGTAEASRAMYNFAQALSSGAVRLIDWKSIENANMATVEFKQTLMDSAVAMGTLVKNEDGYVSTTTDANNKTAEAFTSTMKFNDSLSACWMTSEVLVDALKKYTDENTDFGKAAFAAAQDVKTWSQLLDTLKEALGSGWGKTFELIIGDYNEAKTLFTTINNVLSPVVDKISDFRNNMLQAWVDNGGRQKLMDGLQKLLDIFDNLVDKTLEFSDKALKVVLGPNYQKIFGNITSGLDGIKEAASKAISKKDVDRWQVAYDIWTKASYGVGAERKRIIDEMFQDEGESYAAIQDIIDKIISGEVNYKQGLEDVKKQYEENQKAIEKHNDKQDELFKKYGQTKTVAEKLATTFANLRLTVSNIVTGFKDLFESLKNVGKIFGETFANVFDFESVSATIRDVSVVFSSLTRNIKNVSENGDGLRFIFTRFFNGLNNGWYSVRQIVYNVLNNVKKIRDTIAGDTKVQDKLQNAITSIGAGLLRIKEIFFNIKTVISNILGPFVQSFLTTFNFDKILSDGAGLLDYIKILSDGLVEWSQNSEGVRTTFDKFWGFLNTVYETLKTVLFTVIGIISWLIEHIGNVIRKISEWTSNIDVHSAFYRAWDKISTIVQNLIGWFSKIKTKIQQAFGPKVQNLLKTVCGWFENIYKFISNIAGGALQSIIDFFNSLSNKKASVDVEGLEKLSDIDLEDQEINVEVKDNGFLDKLDKVKDIKFSNPFEKVKEWVAGIFDSDTINLVFEGVVKIGNAILEALGKLDWTNLWRAASFILFVVAGKKIVSILSNIGDLTENAGKLVESLQTPVKNLGKKLEELFDAVADKFEEDSIKMIMISIGALMLTLISLTQLPTDKVIIAGGIIIGILYMFGKIIESIKKADASIAASVASSGSSSPAGIAAAGVADMKRSLAAGAKYFGIGFLLLGITTIIGVSAWIVMNMKSVVQFLAVLGDMITIFGVIGLLVAAIYFLMNRFGSRVDYKQILTLSAIVGAVALVFVTVAVLMQVLNGVDLGAGAVAALVLVPIAFIGSIVLLMVAIKKVGLGRRQMENVDKLATVMSKIGYLVMSMIPIILIFGIFKALGVNIGSFVGFFIGLVIGISGLMAAFVGMLKLANGIDNKRMIVFASVISTFIILLTILTSTGILEGIVGVLSQRSWIENLGILAVGIIGVGLALIVLFAGFSALLWVVNHFLAITPETVMKYAKSFMYMGAGFAAIGVGVLAIVAAMGLLPEAAQGLVAFGAALEEHGPQMARTAAILAILIISGFLAGFAVVKGKTALTAITFIVEIFLTLAAFLHGHVPEIVGVITDVIIDVIALLTALVDVIADLTLKLCMDIFAALAMALIRNLPRIVNLLWSAIKAIVSELLALLFEWIGNGIKKISRYINEKLHNAGLISDEKWNEYLESEYADDNFFSSFAESIRDTEAESIEVIRGVVEENNKEMDEMGSKIKDNIKKFKGSNGDLMNSLFDELIPDSAKSRIAATGLSNMISDNANNTARAADDWGKTTGSIVTKIRAHTKELQDALTDQEYQEARASMVTYDEWLNKQTKNSKGEYINQYGRILSEGELQLKYQSQIRQQWSVIDQKLIKQKKENEKKANKTTFSAIGDWMTGGGKGDQTDTFMNAFGLGDLKLKEGIDVGDISLNTKVSDITAMDFNAADFMLVDENGNQYPTDENGNYMLDENFTVGDLKKAGYQGGEDWAEGVEEGTEANYDDINETVDELASRISLHLGDELYPKMIPIGHKMADNLFQQFMARYKSHIDNENNKADIKIKAMSIGKSIVDGIVEGAEDKMWYLSMVAQTNANEYLTAFCHMLGIASPSKVMRQNGMYMMEGLVLGLTDGQQMVNKSAITTSNSLISTFRTPMDYLISYLNGELEYDPSIRPTMDISGVRNGVGTITGLVNGTSMELGSNVSMDIDKATLDRIDYSNSMMEGNPNGNVVKALETLNGDVNRLNENMASMQIVMDTGALVGQMAQPMDNALGRRQYLRGRGF